MFVCLRGKQFAFRGCGWRNARVSWTEDDKVWIRLMAYLFVTLLWGGLPEVCILPRPWDTHRGSV